MYMSRMSEDLDPKKLIKRVDYEPLMDDLRRIRKHHPMRWYCVGAFPNRNLAASLRTYGQKYLEWGEDIETCTTNADPQRDGSKAYYVWARLVENTFD